MVVIEGPPGVGKSTLIAHVLAQAEQANMVTLSAAATALDRPVAFGLARQLFGPVLATVGTRRRAALLDGAARPARRLFARPDAVATGPPGSEGVIEGLYWLTENLSAGVHDGGDGRPLVFAFDDAHWSDEGSLRFLGRLVSHLRSLSALLVVASRPNDPGAASLLDDLVAHPLAEVLRPAALSDQGSERLVRVAFPDAEPPFAQACSRASGGNPFFLTALLDDLAGEGVPATAETAAGIDRLVPSAAARSILIRLARLPVPAVALARSLAVLGDRSPLHRVATLADLDRDTSEDAADALAGAHLINAADPLTFTHPLIGAAIAADVPSFARGRAHRAAAELLAGSDAPDARVAAHLLACRPQGDPWVVSTLRSAAVTATAAGEHRAASQFLARALQEPPADSELAPLRVAAALAAAANAEAGSYEALAGALTLIDEPDRRAEASLALSRLLILRGAFAHAATAAEEGLGQAIADGPTAQALLAALLIAASRDAPRRADALARFEPLVAAAQAGRLPDDPILSARLASRMATAGHDPHRVRALATTALRDHPLVDPHDHGMAFAFVAAGIYWIDDYVWCKEVADAALEAARRRGTPVGIMAASHWQAAACRQLGHLDEAVVAAERSLAVARNGWAALAGWTATILAVTHVERGDLPAARHALEATDEIDPASLDWAFVLGARATLDLAEDDPAGALANSHAAGAHLAAAYRIDNPAVLPWRSLAALAAHRLNRPDEATELALQELRLTRRLNLPRPLGNALRVSGMVACGPEAVPMLEEAVVVLRASQAVVAHAHALVALGASLRRGGQPSAAREPLAQALRLAESCKARPLLDHAEAELHAAGGRRHRSIGTATPQAALTPTQHRVAKLAAEGLSNPQIAQRLYVTTKTVEWHLGHIYRQLGITRRDQIAPII